MLLTCCPCLPVPLSVRAATCWQLLPGCRFVRPVWRLMAGLGGVAEVGFQHEPTTLHPSNCRATPGWQGGLVCGCPTFTHLGCGPNPGTGLWVDLRPCTTPPHTLQCIASCVCAARRPSAAHLVPVHVYAPCHAPPPRPPWAEKKLCTTPRVRRTHTHVRFSPLAGAGGAPSRCVCVSLYCGVGVAQTPSLHAHTQL